MKPKAVTRNLSDIAHIAVSANIAQRAFEFVGNNRHAEPLQVLLGLTFIGQRDELFPETYRVAPAPPVIKELLYSPKTMLPRVVAKCSKPDT